MKLIGRVRKAEGDLTLLLLWSESQKVGASLGLDADELYAEAQDILMRYGHLARPGLNGLRHVESMLHAFAADSGLVYSALVAAVRSTARRGFS